MFGLWYLSLAIEEFRKYLGWSSIFDIFTTKKTGNHCNNNNAALEDKPLSDDNPAITSIPAKPNDNKIIVPSPSLVEKKQPAKITTDQVPDIQTNNQLPKLPPTAIELPKFKTPAPPASPEIAPKNIEETVVITPSPAAVVPTPKSSSATPSPPILPTKSTNKVDSDDTGTLKSTATAAAVVPAAIPAVNGTKSSSQKTENDINKNLFSPPATPTSLQSNFSPKNIENGSSGSDKDAAISNIKDATTSFLQEEGKLGNLRQKHDTLTKRNKSDTMVDAAVLTKLEDGFAKLAASDSKSLLKKHLTKEIFDKLKNVKTPTFGSTLLDCIQSGLENHDSGFGIYAPDAEAYSVFSELFDPMIEDYHTGFKKTDKHPNRDFGDVNAFTNVDPTGEYVVSTRVRCGRSMEGYPFNPCLTEAQYKEMEVKVAATLAGLEGELKGKFYPLTGMDKAVQQQLIDDHFLFKEGDRFLQTANACRYWPSGRGIYHNDNKTFLVWCNEEDHLRIISMQMGGDLGEVYRRLVTAVNDIEKRIPFSHHDRLGFLTFCPTNLGTTIRASVHIKVPKLAANKAKLEEVAGKYNLQVRGTRGEHTEAEGGIYDISNKRRMGLTEFQAVKEMYDGISEIIKLEKSL